MNIITSIFMSPALKITDDETGFEKWRNLAITSAAISSPATTSDIPIANTVSQTESVEEGTIDSNVRTTKIITPSSIEITALCFDLSLLHTIIIDWKNLESTFSINSRSIISKEMAFSGLQIHQSSENISGVKLTLTFEQTSFSITSNYNPSQEVDKDSIGISIKVPSVIKTTVEDFYSVIREKIGL